MAGESEEEKDFRERYAAELRKLKVGGKLSPHFGIDQLSDELHRVARQEMATPGRRGEQIKREEISKEILRRMALAEDTEKNAKGA